MSKILNNYQNGLDKAWYDSSNILYSECDDNSDAFKTLRITFKNGRTYQYKDVKVNDYLLFREAVSQGKALNQYIKLYETERINDVDTSIIEKELETLTNPQLDLFEVHYDEEEIVIMNNGLVIEKFSYDTGYDIDEVIRMIQLLKIKCLKK